MLLKSLCIERSISRSINQKIRLSEGAYSFIRSERSFEISDESPGKDAEDGSEDAYKYEKLCDLLE